jgi:hypothetical protein
MAGEAEKGADAGAQNLADAVSGKTGLGSMNPEQIEALGGEFDEELDGFDVNTVDRGDSLEPPKKEDDDGGEEDSDDKSGDADADEEGSAEDSDDDSESDGEDEPEPEEDSGDAEGDEGEEEESESEEEDPKSRKREQEDEQRIPKRRFDEVNERRKELERELKELKAQQKAGEDAEENKYDFDKAEGEYIELLLDGKATEAVSKRKEIDAARRSEWQTEQAEVADSTVSTREVQRELNEYVVHYEGAYDAFDPKSDSYDPAVVRDVEAMFKGYLDRREDLQPGEAFVLAVDNAIKIYGLEARGGDEGNTTDNNKADEESAKNTRRTKKKNTRKKIADAKDNPKDPGSAGAGGATAGAADPDITQMSDDEFDALPESTKARLRGDVA